MLYECSWILVKIIFGPQLAHVAGRVLSFQSDCCSQLLCVLQIQNCKYESKHQACLSAPCLSLMGFFPPSITDTCSYILTCAAYLASHITFARLSPHSMFISAQWSLCSGSISEFQYYICKLKPQKILRSPLDRIKEVYLTNSVSVQSVNTDSHFLLFSSLKSSPRLLKPGLMMFFCTFLTNQILEDTGGGCVPV